MQRRGAPLIRSTPFHFTLASLLTWLLRPCVRPFVDIQPPSTIKTDAAPSQIGRLDGPPPVTGTTLGGVPPPVVPCPLPLVLPGLPPFVVSTTPPPSFLLWVGITFTGGGAAVGAGVGFCGGVGFAPGLSPVAAAAFVGAFVTVATGTARDGTPVGIRVTPLGTATGTWNVVCAGGAACEAVVLTPCGTAGVVPAIAVPTGAGPVFGASLLFVPDLVAVGKGGPPTTFSGTPPLAPVTCAAFPVAPDVSSGWAPLLLDDTIGFCTCPPCTARSGVSVG